MKQKINHRHEHIKTEDEHRVWCSGCNKFFYNRPKYTVYNEDAIYRITGITVGIISFLVSGVIALVDPEVSFMLINSLILAFVTGLLSVFASIVILGCKQSLHREWEEVESADEREKRYKQREREFNE